MLEAAYRTEKQDPQTYTHIKKSGAFIDGHHVPKFSVVGSSYDGQLGAVAAPARHPRP